MAWSRPLIARCCALVVLTVARLHAADPKPVVGPGATKDAVIDAYGWPNGSSQMGSKEVLNYSQGRVTLENGKVERVDFSPDVPWQTPKPRPGTVLVPVKQIDTAVDFWLTDFEAAKREAATRKARILALFTGSDWSPASRKFQNEVALHEEFANAFVGQFVFLRLDFPTRVAQSAAEKAQNTMLRERYKVTTYPSLLVVSPEGVEIGRVDLAKVGEGDGYRTRIMAAIATVQELAKAPLPDGSSILVEPGKMGAPDGATVAGADTAGTSEAAAAAAGGAATHSRMRAFVSAVTPATVSPMLVIALGGAAGLALAGGLVWLLWQHKPKVAAASAKSLATSAYGNKKGGRAAAPSAVLMSHWSFDKVRDVAAALFEAEGYVAELRPSSGDVALKLTQPGESGPPILVGFRPALGGAAPARVVRELFGTVTVEGAEAGWFVSLGGFSAEATEVGRDNNLTLIDGPAFIARINALDPEDRANVMARAEG